MEHLKPDEYTVTYHGHVIYEGSKPKFWHNISIDLSETTLWRFDLSYCELENAKFVGTRFFGITTFSNIKIPGFADFGDAEFSSIPTFNDSDMPRSNFSSAFARDMIPFWSDPIILPGYKPSPFKDPAGNQCYWFSEVKHPPRADKSG